MMIIPALKSSRKLVVTHLMNIADTLDIRTMKTVTRTRVSRSLRTTSQQTKRTSPRRKLSVVQTLKWSLVIKMNMTVVQWTIISSERWNWGRKIFLRPSSWIFGKQSFSWIFFLCYVQHRVGEGWGSVRQENVCKTDEWGNIYGVPLYCQVQWWVLASWILWYQITP